MRSPCAEQLSNLPKVSWWRGVEPGSQSRLYIHGLSQLLSVDFVPLEGRIPIWFKFTPIRILTSTAPYTHYTPSYNLLNGRVFTL